MRKESFVLPPGHEADVGLSITEIITSDSAIERFTPKERDCYVHDEVNLKSLPLKKGYRMSMKNCLYDKALQVGLDFREFQFPRIPENMCSAIYMN